MQNIIDRLGGEQYLAWKLGVHQVTVYRWKKKGIPEKVWRRIIAISSKPKLSLEDLHAFNESLRQKD